MSKDLNTSNLTLSVAHQWLVPVMNGQLNKTTRTGTARAEELMGL